MEPTACFRSRLVEAASLKRFAIDFRYLLYEVCLMNVTYQVMAGLVELLVMLAGTGAMIAAAGILL